MRHGEFKSKYIKMKKTILLFVFIPFACLSQNKLNLISTINTPSDFFTTDNQSNIYLVNGNELTKYDITGRELYKYSNKNLGNISFVDATNLLRILVFYKDFLQVVFLDNTLSINGDAINLESIGFQQAQLVCSSHNSGIWIYDQQNFSLIRLDQNLLQSQQSGNLSALLGTKLQPNSLVEYNNKLYMNNFETGLLIFDVYGTYYKTISTQGTTLFQPIGDWIYFMSDNKLKAYNFQSTQEKELSLPNSDFSSFRVELNNFFVSNKKAIFIYSTD